ncbi:MAG: hypothetical protein FJ293_06895 [Planctomycetes bacterium]|nr:hypothetical protein [Planctomycetota bacterium]
MLVSLAGAGCAREPAAAPSSGSASEVVAGFEDEPLERPLAGDRTRALEPFARARELERMGAIVAALKQLDAALAADPAFVDALLLAAKLRLADGAEYAPMTALRHARRVRLLEPDLPAAIVTEGLARFVLDDSVRARGLLERFLSLPPENINPSSRAAAEEALGLLAARRGDVDEAAQRMERVLAIRPERAQTHYGLAVVADARGDLVAKERHLEAALQRDALLLPARHERFLLLMRAGRHEEAAREKRILEVLRPLRDDGGIMFSDDYAGRARLWGDLAQLLPENLTCREMRVRELAMARDHGAAADEGDAALRAGFASIQLVAETAFAHARLGRAEAARATMAHLARCNVANGQQLEASLQREVERLLQLAPERAKQ